MSTFAESFPGPLLDSSAWNETLAGVGVSADVGNPTDGYYPIGVDADGDLVYVDSKGKIFVPGQSSFDYSFFYDDLPASIAGLVHVVYIGWRSVEEQLSGDPKHEIVFMMQIHHDSKFSFARTTQDMGAVFSGTIGPDPVNGDGVGGLRIIRENFTYRLLHYNRLTVAWEEVSQINFSDNGLGYITFGNYTSTVAVDTPPWISGT